MFVTADYIKEKYIRWFKRYVLVHYILQREFFLNEKYV